MSATPNKVMPASIASFTTFLEASRSIRPPRLLQPRPISETRRPERPRLRIFMRWISLSPCRRVPVQQRPERHDAVRIDGRMTLIIMGLDVPEIDGLAEARLLKEKSCVVPKRFVIGDAAQVAFEMTVIDGIETHQRGEQADIRFGERVADQEALLRKSGFEPV